MRLAGRSRRRGLPGPTATRQRRAQWNPGRSPRAAGSPASSERVTMRAASPPPTTPTPLRRQRGEPANWLVSKREAIGVIRRRSGGMAMASTTLPVRGELRCDWVRLRVTRGSKQETRETYAPTVLREMRAGIFGNTLRCWRLREEWSGYSCGQNTPTVERRLHECSAGKPMPSVQDWSSAFNVTSVRQVVRQAVGAGRDDWRDIRDCRS